jgi:hypothetical protein
MQGSFHPWPSDTCWSSPYPLHQGVRRAIFIRVNQVIGSLFGFVLGYIRETDGSYEYEPYLGQVSQVFFTFLHTQHTYVLLGDVYVFES